MNYIRFSEGLNNNKLIPVDTNPYDYIKNPDKDYYTSIFEYNEEHHKHFNATKSLQGIEDVTTNKLVFDFDSKADLKEAQSDTLALLERLKTHGIAPEQALVCFSGRKGFHVQVDLSESISQKQFKDYVLALGANLKTFDQRINDPQRIIRMVGTRHQETKMFKTPLTVEQLKTLDTSAIEKLASDRKNLNSELMDIPNVELPVSIKNLRPAAPVLQKAAPVNKTDLDFRMKPKWLTDLRYALQEGHFPSGEGVRNHVFMVLCATYKKQGFNEEMNYRMLKGVAERQSELNNCDRFPDKELWNKIVQVVYADNWKGGIYKDNEDPTLIQLADRIGINVNKPMDVEYEPAHIHSIHEKFKDYVKNIKKNTIKTGIKSLDDKVFISVGANVGIVGAPGSGKSSLALNILNNTSKAGIKSVFASFDMARTRMYEKILYKISGKTRDQLYEIFEKNPEEADRLEQKVKEEFGNVYFFDKSAATVSDIKDYINRCNEMATSPDEKVKLVLIDYFEMVTTDVGDDNAASKKVAQELQGIVNTMDVAQIVLLQPNKMTGDMREPITSYTSIKGSSFLAQSFRIALGIYREGFNPENSENDRFLSINILKNDLGESGRMDFSWDGRRGEIDEIASNEEEDLDALRRQLKMAKSGDDI